MKTAVKQDVKSLHTKGTYKAGVKSILCEFAGITVSVAKTETSYHISEEIAEANAAHIVKCVNAHNELVKALTDIIELEFQAGSSRSYIENILRIAKKALYKI